MLICSSFIPRMRKPASWMWAMIFPAWPFCTASGLMMASVRDIGSNP
jgi:hypothetical protein